MLASRTVGLAGTAALIAIWALPVAPATAAPPPLAVEYNAAVYGDFTMAGNTVTACPPVKTCLDAQNRIGAGPLAQNNGHAMGWADIDDDPSTYDSSSGRQDIPRGARVRYAKLNWAGVTGGPCAAGSRPPGTPRSQPVSLTVNGTRGRIRPDRFTDDRLFYSARADITDALREASGPVTITVGHVWTPRGYDCFGGWSVVSGAAVSRWVAGSRAGSARGRSVRSCRSSGGRSGR